MDARRFSLRVHVLQFAKTETYRFVAYHKYLSVCTLQQYTGPDKCTLLCHLFYFQLQNGDREIPFCISKYPLSSVQNYITHGVGVLKKKKLANFSRRSPTAALLQREFQTKTCSQLRTALSYFHLTFSQQKASHSA